MTLEFFVPGKPATAGSKRAFLSKTTNKMVVKHDNPRHAEWRRMVRSEAREKMSGEPLIDGPVRMHVIFWMKRPGSPSIKKRPYPIVTPDLDKMVRAINDALTGVVFKDDSQVVVQRAEKFYGETPGARVRVEEMA